MSVVSALLTLPSPGWSAQLTEATVAAWDRRLEGGVAESSSVTSLRQAREAVLARARQPESRSRKEHAACEIQSPITSP